MTSDGIFRWYWAPFEDSEVWSLPFDTRAAAIADAARAAQLDTDLRRNGYFLHEADRSVVSAATLNTAHPAQLILDELIERNDTCWLDGDPDGDVWTPEAQALLAAALKDTVTAWLTRHPGRTFCCGTVRSTERMTGTGAPAGATSETVQ